MRPFYTDNELFEEGTVITRQERFGYNNRIGPKLIQTNPDVQMFTFTIEKPYPLFEQLNIYFDFHVKKNLKFHTEINYTGKYIVPSISPNVRLQYFFNMGDYLVELKYNGKTYTLHSNTMENLFHFTDKVKKFQGVKTAELISLN